jgi:hypothetical protein
MRLPSQTKNNSKTAPIAVKSQEEGVGEFMPVLNETIEPAPQRRGTSCASQRLREISTDDLSGRVAAGCRDKSSNPAPASFSFSMGDKPN